MCIWAGERDRETEKRIQIEAKTEKHSTNSPEGWNRYLSSIMLSWMQNSPFPLYSYKKTLDKRWGNSTASNTAITPDLHFLKKKEAEKSLDLSYYLKHYTLVTRSLLILISVEWKENPEFSILRQKVLILFIYKVAITQESVFCLLSLRKWTFLQ